MNLPASESRAGPIKDVPPRRRVRICCFNFWSTRLECADDYALKAPSLDLAPFIADRSDTVLMRKARLDCDWYAENVRCFGSLQHEAVEFSPAWVSGAANILELAQTKRETDEEIWLILTGHQPQALAPLAGKVFRFLASAGVKIAFYAFDEASRFMPCFGDIAPYLDLLIHDESPLDPKNRARLRPDCVCLHRSWVANFVPYSVAFNEAPERKIVFLGSQLGLTAHRIRQIEFLRDRFKDRFIAICDHSLAVSERGTLSRYAVSVCPEGRKFSTPGMSRTHTDRPFWSGCLGMVPVSEDSLSGGRLEPLANAGLIVRYRHGDLESLAVACEHALAMTTTERRRIYDHFNSHETVGSVLAEAIATTVQRAHVCG